MLTIPCPSDELLFHDGASFRLSNPACWCRLCGKVERSSLTCNRCDQPCLAQKLGPLCLWCSSGASAIFCQSVTEPGRGREMCRTDQLKLLLLWIQHDVKALQVFVVSVVLFLHLHDVYLAICILCLQVAHLFLYLFLLALRVPTCSCTASAATSALPFLHTAVSSLACAPSACTVRSARPWGYSSAVSACTWVLQVLFSIVLMCNNMVHKPLEFSIMQAEVLVKVSDTVIVGCFEL